MLSQMNIIVALIIVFMPKSLIEGVMEPTNTIERGTTCDEFSRSARFNPYSVIGDDVWMVFYYWSPHTPHLQFKFKYPKLWERHFLKGLFADEHVTVPVNWTARFMVMQDQATNESMLLVEKGDRGQYWLYIYFKREDGKSEKVKPLDVRFKQTGDNKYIGIMYCETEIVYILARRTEIPPQTKIQDAASCIGYRGRGGKSYLYQGHEWMPIGEADEQEYWNRADYHKKFRRELKEANRGLRMQQAREKTLKQKIAEENDHYVEKNIML